MRMEASEVKQLAKRSDRLRPGLSPNASCTVCGDLFYASPSQKASGGGRYCGFACRSIATGGRNHPNWNEDGGLCECVHCHAQYHQKPSTIRAGKHRRYCSTECRKAATTKSVQCQQCGLFLTVPVSRTTRVWCSIKCRKEAKKPLHNCTCRICGRTFYNKDINRLTNRKRGAGAYCSNHCKHKAMSRSPRTVSGVFRGVRGGRRPDLDNRYFRSRWEANYARYLNWLVSAGQIHSWEYEPDTFEFPVKRGNRLYTPDFKVFNNDGSHEYHEVKGWMDRSSVTKLKRMTIHHKHVKVVLIDSSYYRALAKQISGSIPGWESGSRGPNE